VKRRDKKDDDDDSNNTEILSSLKINFTGFILALQEALTFEEKGNKTIHYFSNSEALFKCEGGFYSAGQILALKDIELGLTILFKLYICPTEVILRLFRGIQFQVKSLTFGLKRSEKVRFISKSFSKNVRR
jgi:hypothetical protein